MASTTRTMKLARTSEEEVNTLLSILNEVEQFADDLKTYNFEDICLGDYPTLKKFDADTPETFLEDLVRYISGIHFSRILWNTLTMLNNCADLSKNTLEFSPEITKALELVEFTAAKKKPFKSIAEILEKMEEEMPWQLPKNTIPYIKEAMQRYANQKLKTNN